jgi:hypothetical protein
MFNQILLLFQETPKFLGVLGTQQDRWAVEITSPVKGTKP